MDDRFNVLGRLTTGVAHDLSNYLWVVELSLLKLERQAREAGLGSCVESARVAAQRGQLLSQCLLAYARGETPVPAAVDLAGMVRRVLQLFRSVIPERVAVVVHTEADVPPVDGIAPELEQMLLHLVLNACDAMPEGGILEVTVRAADSSVSLDVAGSGPPPATPPAKVGRGLGIVRGVADRHDATLEIAPRPGGGTAFVVSFPSGGTP